MPEFHILENTGETAAEFFDSTPGFSGNHDATAEMVASGQYQVGAINLPGLRPSGEGVPG